MHPQATAYFQRADKWPRELAELRRILLEGGLSETFKWRSPCYVWEEKNVAILGQLKEACTLGFMKGALISDPESLLIQPGVNSRSVRNLAYTEVGTIIAQEDRIRRFIRLAVEVEKSGEKVAAPQEAPALPEELLAAFDQDPGFQAAFQSLTPGRQRGYLLHFSSARQATTRRSRIEQSKPKVFAGKGFHDCNCGLSQRMPRCDGSHTQLREA